MSKMCFQLKLSLLMVIGLTIVDGRQQWEEEPGYREVNPQGDIVMTCRVRNKKGECRWERDNTPIAAFPGKYEWAGDTTKGDCSLRILQANFEYDNGAWVCQVTASSFKERDTLISHPANLVVRAPPTAVHLRLPGESSPFTGALVATSGKEVELECVAKGGNPPPGLQWYIAGKRWEGSTEEINQEMGETVSVVKFPVRQLDDKKEIRCEVIHEALDNGLTVSTSLDVQYLPQVSVEMSGDGDDISQGDTVIISCRASGNPTPDIVWYRDGSGEIVSRSQTLTISDIRRDQAGVYVCQADNSVGQSEPRKIDVAVKYGPVITSVGPSQNVTLLLRSKLELTCQATGNPSPHYTWIHHTETGSSIVGHERNLIVTGVGYHEQGNYECRATNIIKGHERQAKSSLIDVNITGAPRVKEKRSEVFILQGTDAVVSVEFCADPKPELKWHIGGQNPAQSFILNPLTSHEKFSVLQEEPASRVDCYISTLKIDGADKTDSRDYELHLENHHGQERHTVRVNVGDRMSNETLIGAIVGGIFVFILIAFALLLCSRRCCPSKQLKQDMESPNHMTDPYSQAGAGSGGWSSQSDVSITTDPSSEMSTGTSATTIPDIRIITDKYYGDNLSISQECVKTQQGGFISPTPSNLTDRPPSNASGPSRVSYNDLCFPKTANYGSMRKSGKCDIEAKLQQHQGMLPPLPTHEPKLVQEISPSPALVQHQNYHYY